MAEIAGEWRDGIIDRFDAVFPRVIAIFLLLFAVQYWTRLTGFRAGPEFRFDTMSDHWRVASASLAVLFPVAALGLWGRFSWGFVVWLLAAGGETVMHVWLTELYGRADFTVGFHLVTFVIFVVLRVAARLMANGKLTQSTDSP